MLRAGGKACEWRQRRGRRRAPERVPGQRSGASGGSHIIEKHPHVRSKAPQGLAAHQDSNAGGLGARAASAGLQAGAASPTHTPCRNQRPPEAPEPALAP